MSGRIRQLLVLTGLATLAASEARANDGAAGLAAGELIFKHLDGVRMESEDLFISEKEVRVRYSFRNTTDHDIESVVAFPLPPIPAKDDPVCTSEDAEWAESYNPCSDNPLGFAAKVDGKSAPFQTERKPLPPDPKYPLDRESSVTHYWTQRFPAGRSLVIEHSYKPSEQIEWVEDTVDNRFRLRREFCVGTSSHKSLFDILRGKHSGPSVFLVSDHVQVRSIKYILKTALTWDGPIGRFHLTIEKSSPRDFVSLCLDGLRKTSPTRYERVANDYAPRSDLAILIFDGT